MAKRREIIVASHAAVATDDERCSQIAMKVLKGDGFPKPGNAVDAAVAAALSLGVVSLASSGIGGGAFMLLRLANGKTEAFDMRECSHKFDFEGMANMVKTNVIPNMANVIPNMANVIPNAANGIPNKNFWEVKALILKAVQALSIAVPGELAGLYNAWKDYGSLPWESLVKPAEDLAFHGFKISDYLHYEMCLHESEIKADEGLSEILTSNGKLLNKGDICRDEKLGETLKKISKEGIKPFYEGKIGEALIEDIEKLGGIVAKLVGGCIKMTDMRSYKAIKRNPIKAKISELELIGMPPPSAGGAGIALMVKILNQYGGNLDLSSNLGIHRKIEAFKHVLAMSLNIGDPDFVDCSKVISDMLSDEFAKKLKETIDDNKTLGVCQYGERWNEIYKIPTIEHGTSHFSIVDKDGNAVAMTSSVNNHFGAKFRSRRTGIVLNDQMYDFSIPFIRVCRNDRKPANFIAPGKRPLSSMSPTIILKNGKLNAVVGGSGGLLIIPAVAEVILNYHFRKMDELSCIMNPRCYPRMEPNKVFCENFTTVTGDHIEIPEETRETLKEKGHGLKELDYGAICQIITLKELLQDNRIPMPKKAIVAVSDPRKGGAPAGY